MLKGDNFVKRCRASIRQWEESPLILPRTPSSFMGIIIPKSCDDVRVQGKKNLFKLKIFFSRKYQNMFNIINMKFDSKIIKNFGNINS